MDQVKRKTIWRKREKKNCTNNNHIDNHNESEAVLCKGYGELCDSPFNG